VEGKVAIVTGAGRGIGRTEALELAAQGAKVVVNDLGGARTGEGSDAGPAQDVVDEIKANGGEAVANTDNVADWQGGQNLVNQAIEAFGTLDILVNNAGILRDKMSFNMDEAEWDAVIAVHLKGHFTTSRFAASYWRQRSKETGSPVDAAIVGTLLADSTSATAMDDTVSDWNGFGGQGVMTVPLAYEGWVQRAPKNATNDQLTCAQRNPVKFKSKC
jgi:NAD(P)-dependent dehydrogenase (short-subunit alcohol dehydrogenase family)